MGGYSKEKADKLIDQHEKQAKEDEKTAKELRASETFDTRHSDDMKKHAQSERDKADNLRALKKSWGD